MSFRPGSLLTFAAVFLVTAMLSRWSVTRFSCTLSRKGYSIQSVSEAFLQLHPCYQHLLYTHAYWALQGSLGKRIFTTPPRFEYWELNSELEPSKKNCLWIWIMVLDSCSHTKLILRFNFFTFAPNELSLDICVWKVTELEHCEWAQTLWTRLVIMS